MKKIILAILSVLYLVSYGQLEKKNDLTEENLKGKVKSIKETTYKAVDKFGQIKKGNVLNNYFTIYNKKGNTIEGNEYYSDGSLNYKTTYKYDEKGNKIEKNTYKYDGSLNYKTTYKYDEKGNKIEKNIDGSVDRLGYKYTYKYDEKGNTIEQNIYYHGSRPAENYSYKYEYDKNNNWTQEIEYFNTIPVYITERIIEYYP